METENLNLGNWRQPPSPPIQLNTSSVFCDGKVKGRLTQSNTGTSNKGTPPPFLIQLNTSTVSVMERSKGSWLRATQVPRYSQQRYPPPPPPYSSTFPVSVTERSEGSWPRVPPPPPSRGCGGRKPELGNKGNTTTPHQPPLPPTAQHFISVMESSEGSQPRGPPPSQSHQPLHRQKMGKNFAYGTCELKKWCTVGRVVCRNRTSIRCLRLFMSVPCKTEVFWLATFFLEVSLSHVCCAPPPPTHYFLNAYFYPSAVMSMLFLLRAC